MDDHPLPWRWFGASLIDAAGHYVIAGPGGIGPQDAYGFAVTERAGAMEQTLRELTKDGVYCRHADGDSWCPDDCPHERGRALLAEIDAAKERGDG